MVGISLPEGVDPSFLAALPEDIRREVLQNQLGIRPPSRPAAATALPSTTAPVLGGQGLTEVSPEFLAALPPAIQEEVRDSSLKRNFMQNDASLLDLSSEGKFGYFKRKKITAN